MFLWTLSVIFVDVVKHTCEYKETVLLLGMGECDLCILCLRACFQMELRSDKERRVRVFYEDTEVDMKKPQ